jgi:tetratricopeptide (TPR) repeat protein
MLSSALAQLGNLRQPAEPEQKLPAAQQRNADSAMPPEKTAFSEAQPSEPSFAASAQRPRASQPPYVFESVSSIANAAPTQETPLTSAYRADPLLDSELETTMKRPAIHLQPIQHGAGDKPGTSGRGRPTERKGQKEADGNLSNHDRLLRGYQHQLAGSYDDAMQEYRIIIRNAPELLDDVISNVRALLKLAPRFSLGYRVLGDAYMRKGEYLQAMEAYNKALTMAKKARS